MSDHCTYCGLPVPAPLWQPSEQSASQSAATQPKYCCFGCQFAHAVTQEQGEEGASRWTLTRLGLAVFLTMNVMVCTLALWGMDGPDMATDPLAAGFADLLRFAGLLLTFPVLFLLGRPLLENSIAQFQQGVLSSDLLLLTGVVAAFGYSTVSVWQSQWGGVGGPVYFEVSCMILVLVTLGRWLEATGKLRSTQALDQLQKLLPAEVTRVQGDHTLESVPLHAIRVGDVLRVLPGERLPTDGQLASGSAIIDEQLITGESWPVEKHKGDTLSGGTLNLDTELLLKATATADEGTLPRLIQAVKAAREQKGQYELLADRVSHWFFPVMVCVAIGTLFVHAWLTDWVTGTMAALAVVLIACPCALGLATPMAVWAAMGTAARRGIVFRSPVALERLAGLKAIRFDKTGTLTTGQPIVRELVLAVGGCREELLARAQPLAQTSRHAFSRAIVDFAGTAPLDAEVPRVSHIHSAPGKGIQALWPGEQQPTALGNRRLMDELGYTVDSDLHAAWEGALAAGEPIVLVGWEGRARGLFVLQEELRPAVQEMADWTRRHRLDVAILTGDHAQSAQRLAARIGWQFYAELTPEEKLALVREAHQQHGCVVVVGDGVNDAPALSLADVGIALGCGADVTRNAADVCLLGDDVARIPWLVDLARNTVSTIQSNLAWAFGYNIVGVLIATTGWMHPAVAAILMVGSSLFVISNSLRLVEPEDREDQPRESSVKNGAQPVTNKHQPELQTQSLVEAGV